jgi:hypothetical protein
VSKERVQRLEAAIEEVVPTWSIAPVVRALQAGLASRHVESVMDAFEVAIPVRQIFRQGLPLAAHGVQKTFGLPLLVACRNS